MTTKINFDEYKPIIITFDGTSASGKGTIVRGLKKELGDNYRILDAGLMYRALTYHFQKINKLNPQNLKEHPDLENFLEENINLKVNDSGFVILNEQLLSDKELRGYEIDPFIAKYSEIDEVKTLLIDKQREILQNTDCGWICDGRCMGTAVAPFAEAKFYMDAPLLVRATRRHIDYIKSGKTDYSTEEIKIDLEKRDERDRNTRIAPLLKPEDAIEIDSYKRNPVQGVEIALDYVIKKIIEEGKF